MIDVPVQRWEREMAASAGAFGIDEIFV